MFPDLRLFGGLGEPILIMTETEGIGNRGICGMYAVSFPGECSRILVIRFERVRVAVIQLSRYFLKVFPGDMILRILDHF